MAFFFEPVGEPREHILRRNFNLHLAEGALYVSSSGFHSAQALYPALLLRLGGSNFILGVLQVVVFLAFFLPQIVAGNLISKFRFRRRWVLAGGLVQRLQILLIALSIALFAESHPGLAIVLILLFFATSQMASGLTSPVWFDFFAKTVAPDDRGKLVGLRTSAGSAMAFVNGFILAWLLTALRFPYNFSVAIGCAFVLQFASLFVQRRIVEDVPSVSAPPVRFRDLASRVKTILSRDRTFRRFLFASSFLVVATTPYGFFTAAAFKKFQLSESVVGIYTVLTLGAQVVSGAGFGWLADRKGTKIVLLITAVCFALATSVVWWSATPEWFYAAFVFVGVNVGAEMLIRYNFALECSSESDRAMYVGLMNAWFAPFYLISIPAGWLSDRFGYEPLFAGALLCSIIGVIMLSRVPDPRAIRLAPSSN